MDENTPSGERRHRTIKLWPPIQNTRQMLVDRMTSNLSTPTVFTRKYGCLSSAEASQHAKQIEELAFAIANQQYEQEPDGDSTSVVQLYARECSRLILDVLKGGSSIEEKEVPKYEVISAFQETFFDISRGQRAFIEEDEARLLLKPLTEPENSYTKICLSNRSFGLGAAHVAGPILASIKNKLKEVDLSDFVAGRPESEAIDVMNIFSEALKGSQLKLLNLSDNGLGEKGIRAFEKLLISQSSLEELYLMNDAISKEAAQAVCELVPSTDKLRALHFHSNITGDEGAVAISDILRRCPLLEDFRCSSARIGADGGVALSEGLAQCENLKKLDLRDNMFGVEGGINLSESLYKHKYLREVYLSYLNLEDDGAIAIANALKESAPLLEVLEMAGNDISAEAAPNLSACISEKKSLVKLNLSENDLKDAGAIQISKALGEEHQELKEMDISQNSLRNSGARTVAQALVGLPRFKFLNINRNFISEEVMSELKDILKDKLGPIDENDPDGEDSDESSHDEAQKSQCRSRGVNTVDGYGMIP